MALWDIRIEVGPGMFVNLVGRGPQTEQGMLDLIHHQQTLINPQGEPFMPAGKVTVRWRDEKLNPPRKPSPRELAGGHIRIGPPEQI